MLDEYLWQSKHRPSAVYHAHMLVSKTAALFPMMRLVAGGVIDQARYTI